MSIPERLWRVAKGHWNLAQEKITDAQAHADAYEELAEALREAPPVRAEQTQHGTPVLPSTPVTALPGGQHDPLEAAYLLLRIAPGTNLATLEQAYEDRKAELHPEYYAAGSPERAAVEARRQALDAAYAKLRDALNPVETRFERLEF